MTQDINTATSSGRMMLNILITFSQYERELITERIRDKISASKMRGMWTGCCVPFGYKVVDKKLVVIPEEAETVRWIFQRFIEIQSPKMIAQELNMRNVKNKQGKEWKPMMIYHVLGNYTYMGEVKYKDAVCKGEQEAIVSREVWTRVHEILAANDPVSDHSRRQSIIAPLKGILRCGHCGGAMMPTYTQKGTRRYYYYLCGKDDRAALPTCPVHQIPAGDVEEIVRVQLKKMLSEKEMVNRIAEKSGLNTGEILETFQNDFWTAITPGEMNRLITLLVEKAVVREDKLEIEFKTSGIKPLMKELKHVNS